MTEPSQPDVDGTGEDVEEIRGEVVDFLSTREVIMSVGKKDGVKIGMRFVILGHVPVEVGEGDEKITENVEIPKSVVKVVRLSGDRLSIGRTFRTIKGRPAYEVENPMYMFRHSSMITGPYGVTEPTIKYPAIPDRIESFDVESKETVRGKADMTVRKGDEVRLTTGEEFL
ncbi:hypothetical protein [Mycobacterium deserti]|uniref:Uncharacterized protein n=1 Tax=Mycobacterium deserti TaxID=2978347 RepID=A0ABT2M3J4_9MYCO|nr:hypothetical protein [Mycobacterium deserti]MCT7656828.1 hypothetical protein [Mycobacterium deserti]